MLALALLAGCRGQPPAPKPVIGGPPTVHVTTPTRRTIDYVVEQPGFITAYDQTAIYSKVTGFIQAYYVDIGDEVKKGELLTEIFVPELHQQHDQTVAQVAFDQQMVAVAQEMVAVAESNVQTAVARWRQAKADVGKFQADVARWDIEVQRLTRTVAQGAADKEVLTEAQRQFASTKAAKDAADAAVVARQADQVTAEANLAKAKVDVATAQAKVKVSQAAEGRVAALLSYTLVTSPYDGVVTIRNANVGDYVQAMSGDRSTPNPSPIFSVARTDILRIFTDVPERYARYVRAGTKAAVRADALSGYQIFAPVTRTSWAIRQQTRTLWTEIDLTKKEYDGLLPGMYVYADVFIHRANVYAVPPQALRVSGNQTYCFLLKDGKAAKTPVEAGVSDGSWTEIERTATGNVWSKVTGKEQVILGNLDELSDGEAVEVVASGK